MLYDERFIAPMRAELTEIGFEELRTPDDVAGKVPNAKGTTLVVVNSMCGCAARNARPGVALALQQAAARPDNLFTVFAGQDADATAQARAYFTGYAPSSPSIALLRDGRLVYMMERFQIEGRPAQAIAADLATAFERYCGAAAA
jgi:putative YphP/YqiW family bacilliredoxin